MMLSTAISDSAEKIHSEVVVRVLSHNVVRRQSVVVPSKPQQVSSFCSLAEQCCLSSNRWASEKRRTLYMHTTRSQSIAKVSDIWWQGLYSSPAMTPPTSPQVQDLESHIYTTLLTRHGNDDATLKFVRNTSSTVNVAFKFMAEIRCGRPCT